jgi:hypothetical protein
MRWVKAMPLLAVALVAGPGVAADWTTVTKDGVVIRVRERPDIPGGREFWAEGDLAAPLSGLKTALQDHAEFRRWMPRVKESRVLSEFPGGRVTYTLLELPVISNRDYVLRVEDEEGRSDKGETTFVQRWVLADGVVPERRGAVRLKRNEGSWHFTQLDEARVHFVYRFTAEPGGSIPGFLSGVGQTDAVVDTVRALESRAKTLSAK